MALPSDASHPAPSAAAPPVRVLVVDDSAYMRFTIGKCLSTAPGLEVVGTARDGWEALDQIQRLQPDVVTLDVEMPRLDGLSTLREIMTRFPRPVVMLSSLTQQGATETIQALTWGAVDFVAKPQTKANIAAVMDEVIAKVRTAAGARVIPLSRAFAAATSRPIRPPDTSPRARAAAPTAKLKPTRARQPQDKVIIIGASTGGPHAISTVIQDLPSDLPAAILVIQHMPIGLTHTLAERLNTLSALAVKEAETGDTLQVGRVLLAPGGYHMTIGEHDQVELNQKPNVHGVRPAVDVTMVSVAQRYGAACIGVILTGMGRDGTNGAMLIHSAGGKVIAQDEATCVVWGMPRSVSEAGVADMVVPLPRIATAISQTVRG